MNLLHLLRSFYHGFAGLGVVIRSEQNMRIHLAAAVVVSGLGVVFRMAAWEWVAVILCMALVLAAECLNTGIERLADRVTREDDELIRRAKDSAAAGVLVTTLAAAAIGAIIFLPKAWAWLSATSLSPTP